MIQTCCPKASGVTEDFFIFFFIFSSSNQSILHLTHCPWMPPCSHWLPNTCSRCQCRRSASLGCCQLSTAWAPLMIVPNRWDQKSIWPAKRTLFKIINPFVTLGNAEKLFLCLGLLWCPLGSELHCVDPSWCSRCVSLAWIWVLPTWSREWGNQKHWQKRDRDCGFQPSGTQACC